MERTIAVKKLTKMLGKTFGYRINDKAPTPDERAAALAELPAAGAERKRLGELKDAREKAILAADAEYQALTLAYRAARKRSDELSGMQHSYRITVGKTVMGLFFSVEAEGDSWEEIFAKLAKKQVAKQDA